MKAQNQSAMALVNYNRRKIYASLLAIERHLSEQASENAANPSHCVRKHTVELLDHDGLELINHSSRVDPALADDAREFREKAERILRASNDLSDPTAFKPDLGEVASLRNEFRQMVGDPTLLMPCKVCSLDQAQPKVESTPDDRAAALSAPPPMKGREATAARRRLLRSARIQR